MENAADRVDIQGLSPGISPPWRVAPRRLNRRAENMFDIRPDAATRGELASFLGLSSLRKLRLAGALTAEGDENWRLEAMLGATVVQPCVVSTIPVTTRIDIPVRRLYRRDMPQPAPGEETAFDGDDESEPLENVIDLMALLSESLALAIPDYPRAPDVQLPEAVVSPPDQDADEDAFAKPFASLAKLRDKLPE